MDGALLPSFESSEANRFSLLSGTGLRTLYNSVFVINPRGEIIGKHRKINVRSDSLSWSSPGEAVVPLQCDGMKVGFLVCADAFTPDIAGTMKSKGAQILVSPASWGPGIHGPNGEWEERTRETGLPLIVCNRTGAEQTLDFRKAPSVVVKNGRRLLSHTSEQSAVLIFDWNLLYDLQGPLSTKQSTLESDFETLPAGSGQSSVNRKT
jgi:N-carbamoylputrescine amidase